MSAKLAAETESAPKTSDGISPVRRSRRFLLVAIAAIVALSTALYWIATHYHSGQTATLGSRVIALDVVNTDDARERGLSGRDSLTEGEGMLFTFDEPDRYCFWMKDMRFPIDIIWLDAERRVVAIEKRVDPTTYPHSFCPERPAESVLEVAAGVADKAGLKEGDRVRMHSGLVL